MEHSGLPLQSLLGLFGALLMLSPELLPGIAGMLFELPVTDPEVQEPLAFSVRKYNQKKVDSTHYFKVLRVLKAQMKVVNGRVREYHIKVELVETTCEKKLFEIPETYKKIQACEQLPGNPKTLKVYFTLHR